DPVATWTAGGLSIPRRSRLAQTAGQPGPARRGRQGAPRPAHLPHLRRRKALLHPPLAGRMPRLHRQGGDPMNTPARHLHSVTGTWQDTDPVLAALRAAPARRDQADRDIRLLLAYARELATPRPYRLTDLAAATGLSISGVRIAYTPHDIDT